MEDVERFYRTLDIPPGSSTGEIRRAWRDLTKVWHPDRFQGDPRMEAKAEEKLKAINEAYRQLMDVVEHQAPPANAQHGAPQAASSPYRQQATGGPSAEPVGQADMKRARVVSRSNSWADAGLVFGLLSVFLYDLWFPPPFAAALSIAGLVAARRRGGGGKGRAWVGLALGVLYMPMAAVDFGRFLFAPMPDLSTPSRPVAATAAASTPAPSSLPDDELPTLQQASTARINRTAYGDTIILTVRNTTHWRLTRLSVRVTSKDGTARDYIASYMADPAGSSSRAVLPGRLGHFVAVLDYAGNDKPGSWQIIAADVDH